MSQSITTTIDRKRVDDLASKRNEPNWLRQTRLSAWQQYEQLPMPTQRDEDWRKTEIENLDLNNLIALDFASIETNALPLPGWLGSLNSYVPSFSGVICERPDASWASQLSAQAKSDGAIFCSIQEALTNHA